MSAMHTPPAPAVPDRIPSKEGILWTHAITILMGYPLSSESGKCIQHWILYHAIQDPSRPGYKMFIDISSFKHESIGRKRHWLIIVDEFSDYSHSFFLRKKSDQTVVIQFGSRDLFPNMGLLWKCEDSKWCSHEDAV